MRARYSLLALLLATAAARADDPFGDPFFRPTGWTPPASPKPNPAAPKPAPVAKQAPAAKAAELRPVVHEAREGTLYDAATARDPLPLPATAARDCDACEHPYSVWLHAEYLLGTTRGPNVAPLVTTGPAAAGLLAGAPGQPATVALFGGRPVLNDYRSGLRVEAGTWFDREHTFGALARFYTLFAGRENFAARATGTTVLNVPQLVNVNGVLTQIPVFAGFPGVTTGTATGGARNTFTGGDLSARLLLHRAAGVRVDLLAGYRQMYLGDALDLNYATAITGVPATLSGRSAVSSRNDFYGPQLGLLLSTNRGPFALEAHLSTALGATVSDLDFARSTAVRGTANVPATTAALVGAGVPLATAAPLAAQLAAATNNVPLGNTTVANTVTYFGAVAEVGLRAKWQVAQNVRLSAGYGFIYWNNVRRGPEAVTGGDVLRLRASDFSTHMFNFGAELRY
jgi:hypothetical protein